MDAVTIRMNSLGTRTHGAQRARDNTCPRALHCGTSPEGVPTRSKARAQRSANLENGESAGLRNRMMMRRFQREPISRGMNRYDAAAGATGEYLDRDSVL